MNTINISNKQKNIRVSQKQIKVLAQKILKLLKEKDKIVSILLTDDGQIKKLNSTYRNKDSATDVLAFSMREGEFDYINPNILGDIVISVETARRRARERKIALIKEISFYLVHGILHLLGYDDCTARKKMEEKQEKIFSALWKKEN